MDWFKGKFTGNHRFSDWIWGFPVNFPLIQSIDNQIAIQLVETAHQTVPQDNLEPMICMGEYGHYPLSTKPDVQLIQPLKTENMIGSGWLNSNFCSVLCWTKKQSQPISQQMLLSSDPDLMSKIATNFPIPRSMCFYMSHIFLIPVPQ